jgi:hypothetical protein
MSIKKKVLATVIVLAIIVIGAYVLLASQSNQRGGEEGGLASPSVRTFVTLTTVGVSAFITGFGARDVISRAIATRNRLKSARVAKKV